MNAASDAGDDPLRERIEAYRDPWLGTTLGAARAVAGIERQPGRIAVEIVLGFPAADYAETLARELRQWTPVDPGTELAVTVRSEIVAHAVQKNLKPLPGIGNVVAVASGKGHVN